MILNTPNAPENKAPIGHPPSATTTLTSQTPALGPKGKPQRKKYLILLALVVVIAGIGDGVYDWLVGRNFEDTDNAYVNGNIIQITPQITGTVVAVLAEDNDFVKAGQVLVKLDPADAKVALSQAEANLAQAVRQVRTLYANNGTLSVQITARNADVTKAQSDIARANDDWVRRQSLIGNGAVSTEEVNHAKTQLDLAKSTLVSAQAAVSAAKEQLASNQTMTDGTTVELHPSVLAAAAKVHESFLTSQRAALLAPVDGYIAKRTVQLGQRVAAGMPMMSLIPLSQVWVDGNFKEPQLRNIRIGQPVTLTADMYGKKVEYRGVVSGLGVGTGAAFALLPAQNATGNWIKVVQRVPVRIALNPSELAKNPLRIGLSMDATVDVHNKDGKSLADAPRPASVSAASAPSPVEQADAAAMADIQRIISANLGRSAVVGKVSLAPVNASTVALVTPTR